MKKLAVTVFFAMLFFSALIERGFSQAPFYEGKTITIVLGTAAGALGDLRTKALVTYSGGRIFAFVLGLKQPKFVTGYCGPELDIAFLRGETDGRTQSADAFVEQNDDWVTKGIIDLHTIIEVPYSIPFVHQALSPS
jgi:hypothetical protein